MGKVNSHSKRKIWEKTQSFLNFWLEEEIHTFPKIWGKWISMVQKKYGKTHFKFTVFLNILGEVGIHTIPEIWEK